jgi:hypothetical protein
MGHFSFLTARLRFTDRRVLARALLSKGQRMVRCAVASRSAVALQYFGLQKGIQRFDKTPVTIKLMLVFGNSLSCC